MSDVAPTPAEAIPESVHSRCPQHHERRTVPVIRRNPWSVDPRSGQVRRGRRRLAGPSLRGPAAALPAPTAIADVVRPSQCRDPRSSRRDGPGRTLRIYPPGSAHSAQHRPRGPGCATVGPSGSTGRSSACSVPASGAGEVRPGEPLDLSWWRDEEIPSSARSGIVAGFRGPPAPRNSPRPEALASDSLPSQGTHRRSSDVPTFSPRRS